MASSGALGIDDLAGTIAAAVASTVILWVVSEASGVAVTLEGLALFMFGAVVFSFITRQSGDYTAGFVIITIGILMMLAEYILPSQLVSPFGFLVEWFHDATGMNIAAINPWQFTVVAVAAVAIVIGARVRYGGSAGKYIDKVFDRVLREFGKYWDNYVTFTRLLAVFLLGMLFAVLEQSANFLGVFGDRAAEVPFILGNFVIGLAGYMSLGGVIPILNPFNGETYVIATLPLFGTLSAFDFLVFSVVVIAAAAAVKYRGTGPLGRFVR